MTVLRWPLIVLAFAAVFLLVGKDDNFGCDNPGWHTHPAVLETKK